MTDTLDSILSGDEDEEDEVIGQVLDEIGLEYTSKVYWVYIINILPGYTDNILVY